MVSSLPKIIVGFAGMTHLGLVSAIASAEKGFKVICYDPDSTCIDSLKQGDFPVIEPDLPELMNKNNSKISFTDNANELRQCDLIYISPDVPTDDRGESFLDPIHEMIEKVQKHVEDSILIVLSQVPPGFTRRLERDSSRTFYQVETLIFGEAVDRARNPERFIVGCANPAEALPDSYLDFLKRFDCPLLPMRYESAELAKISINCCLVASISIANALAGLCEEIGADWSEIQPALKLDRRIGPHAYLAPGLGLAGGNLERDLATVVGLSAAVGSDARVVRAFIESSNYRRDWVLRLLNRRFLPDLDDPAIALWGLAYKKDTHSTKNSPALALMKHLRSYRVESYDPVVPGTAASALAACQGADILAIMTPWDSFRDVAPDDIAAAMRGRVVIDPYGVFSKQACASAGLDHYSLGR